MATEIIGLDEMKEYLNKTSSKDDAEIQGFIDSAVPVVEYYAGPVVTQVITERHTSFIALFEPPVLSLDSVTAVFSSGTSWEVADLVVDKVTGIVERADGLALFGGPWNVTYTAGRTTVPGNIKLATKIIVKHLWETQRGQMAKLPIGGGIDNVPVASGISYAVPRRALELLRPDNTAGGIA
ncbi:phage gp6-like head-tail connector protein [Amycolatopsis palatopharyngis]|uniref:phage gp6-like head-tail connector protein n=1 Tax=Amycolatopsis palatopharyngis TaxID=187982 RepID=UPI000E22CB46|nr:phage gp6-like head-tail connector protein [Amycolatopsis palatopharyngis]